MWLILFETEHYDPNGRLVAGLAERGWSIGPCPIDQPVCRLAVRRPAPAVVQVSR